MYPAHFGQVSIVRNIFNPAIQNVAEPNNFISGNQFEENSIGILMEGSSRNQINRNSFVRNGYAFKLQASCDDNEISKNNFQQNSFDLVTNGSLVLNSIESNYWDRYEGYDLDRNQV